MATKTKKTQTRVILVSALGQHLLSVPEDGLLVRLKINGNRLSCSFEEGQDQPGISLQMLTWALEKIQVDQIVDQDNPMAAYHPGVQQDYRRTPVEPEPEHAETAED